MQPRHIARQDANQDATAGRAPRLLGATKGGWIGRDTAAFPQASNHANDALEAADAAARDVSIGGVGELMTQDYSAAFAN